MKNSILRVSGRAVWLVILTASSYNLALAADPTGFKTGLDAAKQAATKGGISSSDVPTVISNILKYSLGLMGAIAVAALVYAGFLYLTSAGDDKKAATAKSVIVFTVIGIIVMGLAAVIINSVLSAVVGS